MAYDTYIQGQSIPLTINLNDGTNPIDTDTFDTIEIKVANVHNKDDAGTYSVASGNLAQVSPESEGNVFCDIPPTVTETLSPGYYYVQGKTTETDADYDSSERTRMNVEIAFIILEKII